MFTPVFFRCVFFVCLTGSMALAAEEAALTRDFARKVRPFVETYCLSCHGAKEPEGELDLSGFTTIESVAAGHAYWDLVLERLEAGDMPAEDAEKQPSASERADAIAWIRTFRAHEAARNAGDPGPVLARRLSNAEYNYSIRDLTGADLNPTKTFPIDPANQAGFDNSGESLAMSPALVKKYLEAARLVADHLVLKTDGFEFAPHPAIADTDRDKFAVLRIVEFYKRQPTDYAGYFKAAWIYQHRAPLGKPSATLAQVAADEKISGPYLARVWEILTDAQDDYGPVAKLRAMWRQLPAATSSASRDWTRVEAQAAAMRDFVTTLRAKIVPDVENLRAPPIQNGSQTLVMWKNRQMAANRRKFDLAALQREGGEIAPVESVAAAGAAVEPAVGNAYPAPRGPPVAVAGDVAAPNAGPAGDASVRPRRNPPAAQPPQTDAEKAAARALDARINRGGKFLAPALVTKGSSATSMAASRKRNNGLDPDLVVPATPDARTAHGAAFARFAAVFPDAFYITERARVYRDAAEEEQLAGRLLSAGLHSMTGYFRDDGPLYDLVLDETGRRELDKLWRDFDLSASIPQRMHTSFVWFERTDSRFMSDAEFDPYRPEDRTVTEQDKIRKLAEIYLAKAVKNNASATVQQAIAEHFEIVAANIRRVEQDRAAAEPLHVNAVLDFAARAYRRPLTRDEGEELRRFYREAREKNGLEHEDAIRDCVVAVLMSPNFCYRVGLVEAAGETLSSNPSREAATMARVATAATGSGKRQVRPLSNHALASRLSYFLWASLPDAELLALASRGELNQPAVLAAQAKRMLRDPRTRNFATEFAGHWLDFRRFEEHNAVDRERYPVFDHELRQAMFEEPLRFCTDLVREDRSVLNFLYGDYTFVNAPLAQHYGMPAPVDDGDDDGWARVEGVAEYERGGLLPMAVFLTANSPGLRTSPVKRGYWVVRRILGERIPPPPPTVPELPSDEATLGKLTLRDALARHREDKACAGCHARFDSFGLVFEGFGAIGERREKDFGGRPVDTQAEFPGGKSATGVRGLRDHIRAHRQEDFLDNLCRKLVAFGLGRTLLMSDEALISEMKVKLAAHENRFGALIEAIVTSPQFRTKRSSAAGGSAPLTKVAQTTAP